MTKILQEKESDYKDVFHVVKAAFETAEHSDNKEHFLVEKLRKSNAFIPELSLVAKVDGITTGYILLTKIKIGGSIELALAPLAVLPEYQRHGIGAMLIKESHRIANDLCYHYCVVLGSEKYYPKFGYKPASVYGILPPFEADDKNFMAIKLNSAKSEIKGTVAYPKEFGI